MNERHRQIKFPDPLEFEIDNFEVDPERALWVPGRKKIFLPSAPRETFSWDIETPLQRLIASEDFAPYLLSASDFFVWCKNCVPSRSEVIEGRPLRIPLTYNDIERSQIPAFRSGRNRYNW